jgi:threonine/homoserine/homoserine lactone efflux protein
MDFIAWSVLASVCFLGAITPGPSLAVVLKHTVVGSRSNGVIAGIAHGAGVALYALLAVLGLAVLVTQSPLIFNIIKVCAALFLLWLAYKALTSKSSFSDLAHQKSTISNQQSAKDGFLIAFLNPKLALFFIALFAPFIDVDAHWQQKMIMVLTVGLIDMAWYCFVAISMSQSSILLVLKKNIQLIEKISACVFIGIAISVLI